MSIKSLRRARRVALHFTNASEKQGRPTSQLPPSSLPSPRSFLARSQNFESFDDSEYFPVDRREYNPSPPLTRPAKRFNGKPARVVAPPITKVAPRPRQSPQGRPAKLYNPAALLFQAPKSVAVCVQRNTRKEVIHAKGKAGKKTAPPRRGPYSNIRCK